MIRTLILIVVSLSVVGCGQMSGSFVRIYCDTEVWYNIWGRQEGEYRLYLSVGTVSPQECRTSPHKHREINLTQDVSSLEEADELIDKYRQLYAEKVATREKTPWIWSDEVSESPE